jgi:membrane-associated phospholipid phosphatase
MTALTLMLLLQTGAFVRGQAPAVVELPARPDVVPPNMVLRWNDVALQAIRMDRAPPPMAARNLAIAHVAIFDAVNAITRTHTHYAVEAAPEAGAAPEAAAAGAAYHTLVALFPARRELFDRALGESLAQLPAGGRDSGLELGRFVAEQILEMRRDDGSARAKGDYELVPLPGAWVRTPRRHEPALYPGWGAVAPFAMKPGTQYKVPGPPPLNSPAYAAAYREVQALGSKCSRQRTEEQTQIALFWADNAGTATPPGHWNQIAQTVAIQRGTSLAESARLFALLNITLSDAGLYCWIIKFNFGFWRPITAIRRADEDGNPDTVPDPCWEPLIETPPFPSYTSGHSTFSGSAACLLANFFGADNIRFASRSDGLPGVTRTYEGFWAAAEEAGMSRIYGGIHWQYDNTDGLAAGKVLGQYVYRHYLRPREATVTPALRAPIGPALDVRSRRPNQ